MSLIIREMEIQTTMRYYLIFIRMTIIKKKRPSVGQDVKKLEHMCTVVGSPNNGAATVENSMAIPQKSNI